MKKFFSSKIFIGIACFILGVIACQLYLKSRVHTQILTETERDERFPVTPHDFDQQKLMDAFKGLDKNMQDMHQDLERELGGGDMQISGIERKEDDKFVYYNIPLNAKEKNHELKVSVKDGMISIKEVTPHSESERQFSIDPGLDETKAEVQTLKDRITIKIPKRT